MTAAPAPSRPRWLGWALGAAIPLLALCVALVLWLLMPLWLARLVTEHSPWFAPAFHATAKHLRDTDTDARLLSSMMRRSSRLDQSALTIVFAHVDDPDPGRRALAAAIIAYHFRDGARGKLPVPSWVIASLERMLGDGRALVRVQAGRALLAIGMRASRPRILVAIADLPSHLQPMATGLLAEADDPETAEVVLRWSRSEPIVETTVMTLGRLSDPRITDRLLELLVHPRAGIRRQAALATGGKNDPRLTGALVKACLDPEAMVSDAAVERLGGRDDGTAALAALLDQPVTAPVRAQVLALLRDRAHLLDPEQRQRLGSTPPAETPVPTGAVPASGR